MILLEPIPLSMQHSGLARRLSCLCLCWSWFSLRALVSSTIRSMYVTLILLSVPLTKALAQNCSWSLSAYVIITGYLPSETNMLLSWKAVALVRELSNKRHHFFVKRSHASDRSCLFNVIHVSRRIEAFNIVGFQCTTVRKTC